MINKKEKKIGCIIAYTKDHNNYGTSLQGYAMIKKIQELGYKVEIIHYEKKITFFKKILLIFYLLRTGTLQGSLRKIKERINKMLYKNYFKNIKTRTQTVNKFKEENLLPLFRTYVGYEALQKGSLNYDVVMVGSDQVWLPISLYSKYYNLLFVDDSIPKISYASSFGVSTILSFQAKETGEYLNRFNKIGVREIQGKYIVDELSHNKATVVVDPTLLLSSEEWINVVKESRLTAKELYIFCYFLGKNKEYRDAVMRLKEATGLKIIAIKHMDEYIKSDENFGDESPYDVSPIDFANYIYNASYVCTDSFHGAVLSIVFQRKFMIFYRFKSSSKNSRNSRIDNLLQQLKLTNRLYANNNILNIQNEINYPDVNYLLEKLRRTSIKFLEESLELNI